MIPAGVQVFVALETVDMRLGFERLAGLVRERIGYEARSGALFVFVGRRRESAKVLFFDGTGMCVFYKRLDHGRYALPDPPTKNATHIVIDDAKLETLLDGIEIEPRETATATRSRRVH